MINKYNVDEKNTNFKKHNFKRGFEYIFKYKAKMILVLVCNILAIILGLSMTKITERVINITIPNEDYQQLFILSGISILIVLVTILLNSIDRKILAKVVNDVVEKIRTDLFIHIQNLSTDFFDTRPNGKILVRLTTYVENVSRMLSFELVRIILSVLNIVFVIIFMLITNVTLTLYSSIGIIIMTLIFVLSAKKKRNNQHFINNKSANITAYTVESMRGMLITQAFNREEENQNIYDNLCDELQDKINETIPLWNLSWYASWQIEEYTNLAMYVIGIMVLFPEVQLGTILVMASYSMRLWKPIKRIFSSLDEFVNSIAYLERILELLDEEVTIKNEANAKDIKIKGNVQFKNVSFGYNEEKIVLKNISFEIKQNTKVAFVGATGSGKSTIVSLLERFYDIKEGQITIDNQDIKEYNLSSLRKQITIMLQDNYLFTTSILNNICYGNPSVSKERVIEVCRELNLHDWISSLENGYDTVLNNNGKELSDGQRQLLSYARTIIADPKIIILDEATSKIDLETESIINKTTAKEFKNKTIIVIAHRLSTIVDSDTIYYLSDGKILENGSHKELMKLKGEYYKLFTSQNE